MTDKEEFRKRELNRMYPAFVSSLPKGYLWFLEYRKNFTAFIKGFLMPFVNFLYEQKQVLDGYFLKNDRYVEDWSETLQIKDEGLKNKEDIKLFLRGVHSMTLASLRKLVTDVDPAGTVDPGGRPMRCNDPCDSALWVDGYQFFYFAKVSDTISAEAITALKERIRVRMPAHVVITLNGENVDGRS